LNNHTQSVGLSATRLSG